MTNIGFIGAGGIARAHAFSLSALRYFYNDSPQINLVSVASSREASRVSFAQKYQFAQAQSLNEFGTNGAIDTVFILGPNHTHFDHFEMAMGMPNVSHIYLEKPVCSSESEEENIRKLVQKSVNTPKIQVGFQFLQTPAVREALVFYQSGVLGKPIHFDLKYYHGDYLHQAYRDKRKTRLTPAPDGGAMADLGSHGLSMLIAFLGADLQVTGAMQSGSFGDVPADSDLFSTLSLLERKTQAVGHMSASRVSSGTGDWVYFELFAEKGAIRFNSQQADYFEYYLEESGHWVKQPVGSNYAPVTSFPSGHVPAGWLRSMIHAHYIFLTGNDALAFNADIDHGLAVQRLVRDTATHLAYFRSKLRQ
ncbi:MAG: Gfo/Idh/MocA family oxidoreductase [Cyclobacteriaceae bacterium]|nr:Gfo/Idh/MocA family oxidoreductase [Cyclobacteriaceae bacterium]